MHLNLVRYQKCRQRHATWVAVMFRSPPPGPDFSDLVGHLDSKERSSHGVLTGTWAVDFWYQCKHEVILVSKDDMY